MPAAALLAGLATKALPKIAGSVSSKAAQPLVSGATSLIQGIKAQGLKKDADAAMPEFVDPGMAAYLSELQQKKKSFDTGAGVASALDAIDTTNAGTNAAIVNATGGDVGGTVQALLQSERVSNDAKNQALATGQQQQAAYNSMFSNLLNDISQRKLELKLMRSQQSRAEWAKKQSNAARNFMGALGGLTGTNAPQAGDAGESATPMNLSALNNKGLNFSTPNMAQQTFGSGTAAQNPVVNAGVQKSVFGTPDNAGFSDIISSVRNGFKK